MSSKNAPTRSPAQSRIAAPYAVTAAVAVAILAATASQGLAQSLPAAQAATPAAASGELPPIVVQGATLDKPKAPKRSAPKPVTSEAADDVPSPAPKRKAAGAAKGATPQGAPSGGTAGPPQGALADAAEGPGSGGEGVPINRVGSAVSVVTGEQLKASQITHAADALRSLPGVQVNRNGSKAGLTEVRLRGAEGNQTMVLIDGVEVNDPTTGAFDFSNLLADDIERIEVIRGPQSGLYGAGAVGGVVNIVTRSGRGPLTFTGVAEGGSFGTRSVAGRVSAGTDKAWFSASLQHQQADGFNIAPVGTEEDPYRISQLSLRAGAQLMPGVTLDFSVRNARKSAERDAFDGPIGSLATAFDDNSHFETNLWVGGATLRWDSLDGRFTQILRGSAMTSLVRDVDETFFNYRSDNLGETEKLSYAATYRFATDGILPVKHGLTGQISGEHQSFTPRSDFVFPIEEHKRKQLSYAMEYRADIAERLFLTGNARRDDNDTFTDFDTWRATASLSLREIGLRPHASIGTGVRLPTMFEQFGFFGTFRPNPGIQPEESFGWDAGAELTLMSGRAIVDVTYFDQNLKNKIEENATFTSIINLPGESTRKGVEVSGRWRLTDDLTIGGSYTLLEAKGPDGQDEPRRPNHAGRADIDYRFAGGRGRVNLAAIYNGEMADRGLRVVGRSFPPFPDFAAEPLLLDEYWLVSIAASYKLSPGVEVFGRVENALDARYEEQEGYNTPGIAAYAGVRLTFEEPATASWARYK